MSDPTKILAWKTKDGKVFEDETVAIEHQSSLDLRDNLAKIVERFYYKDMRLDELVDELITYRTDLYKAFGG
jgi:hypothetical protein